MVKTIVISIILIVIAFVFYLYFAVKEGRSLPFNFTGNQSQVTDIIKNLLFSNQDDSFVIIKVSGTENFLQFTGHDQGIQLDFPMATDQQKTLKETIVQVGSDLGLKFEENTGTDGTLFLDFNISGEPENIGVAVNTFLEKVFKTNKSTKLEYECWGLNPKTS